MADGLQLAHSTHYPEAYSKYDQSPELHDVSPLQNAQSGDMHHKTPYMYAGEARSSTILGLRRRHFWTLVIVAIVLMAIIIGGSVGGALAVRKSGETFESNAQPTPSSTTLPSSSTPSQSPVATPSSTPTGTVYTALPFTQVSAINITCPSSLYTSGQDIPEVNKKYQFNCQNNKNMAAVPDLMSFTAYTFQQCVDACMQWNAMGNRPMCMASIISSSFQYRRTSGNGANCWLKNASKNLQDSADSTIASYILPS